MGIQIEFNPDLALRDISEFKNGNRKEEECIPENLEVGKIYSFLTKGKYKVVEIFNDDEVHFDGFNKKITKI